ncbi:MauE/DoxX family redox-associated membrane protein [Pseudoteredinibacter isoporae]|uniref:Methylamine utilization protein MauE n=1 Tax=Pseudoteredinibacter isoporae TaxID=570281 RepID=A0A7X0JT47_9GAMM|nr:MauE/DoxX family redox-associated membrane protein [Pseudoteredinibacter isoporae]MBB6520945.1 putative membrane protein YphA (DoxX/SURF4 family) [Pseudoteredinibacter isoporae]NHO86510.1 hypothetical protein [Pseudoteredinibacter isoporae]NIB25038.1 hypothetical protein [Pseudoteredinibacter isoporae]
MNILLSTCVLLFSYLFLTAGLAKFRHLAYSAEAIEAYQLTPANWSAALARVLAMLEVLLAVFLLIPGSRRFAVPVAALLLMTYALAIGINLLRGRKRLDCGCNGPEARQNISWWLFGRNLLFVALLAVSYQLPLMVDSATWLLALLCSAALILFQQGARLLYQNQMLMSRKR